MGRREATESATENIPPAFGLVRVKWCGPGATGLNVRAHRATGNRRGRVNPVRSKTKQVPWTARSVM